MMPILGLSRAPHWASVQGAQGCGPGPAWSGDFALLGHRPCQASERRGSRGLWGGKGRGAEGRRARGGGGREAGASCQFSLPIPAPLCVSAGRTSGSAAQRDPARRSKAPSRVPPSRVVARELGPSQRAGSHRWDQPVGGTSQSAGSLKTAANKRFCSAPCGSAARSDPASWDPAGRSQAALKMAAPGLAAKGASGLAGSETLGSQVPER